MSHADALDRPVAAARARRPRRGAWMALLGAGGWLLGTATGCAESHDPLTERCLGALAYHAPTHGAVERIERGPSPDGWAVTILYRAETAPGEPLPFLCEYEIGNRWRFLRIATSNRELPRGEIARVNAKLLL